LPEHKLCQFCARIRVGEGLHLLWHKREQKYVLCDQSPKRQAYVLLGKFNDRDPQQRIDEARKVQLLASGLAIARHSPTIDYLKMALINHRLVCDCKKIYKVSEK
jgi:hypothetical protein